MIFYLTSKALHSSKLPPPPFMKFFKNGYNGGGGGGNFYLKWGGSQEWGEGCFVMGDEKFLKSLDIVDRGVLNPLSYEDPPILPIPPFSNVAHPLPLNFPVT